MDYNTVTFIETCPVESGIRNCVTAVLILTNFALLRALFILKVGSRAFFVTGCLNEIASAPETYSVQRDTNHTEKAVHRS